MRVELSATRCAFVSAVPTHLTAGQRSARVPSGQPRTRTASTAAIIGRAELPVLVAEKGRLDVCEKQPALEAAVRVYAEPLVQPLHSDADIGIR